MMGRGWKIAAVMLLFVIVGCRSDLPEDDLEGRITVWHSWSPAETAVLEETLVQFEKIHPGINVISVDIPADQLLNEFEKSGENGMGPSLLIGKDNWIDELADKGLIQTLPEDVSTTELVVKRTRGLGKIQERVYGVPLSLAPRALYYNKEFIKEVPIDLDALVREAAGGNLVAFVPTFEEAYWGIQSMGIGLFDDQERFTLAESGFTEWLQWLHDAQQEPGFILNVDDQSLLKLFTTGQIAYYVAGPEKQAAMPEMLDEETPFEYGVEPLPEGPEGKSGPLMGAESIMLYSFLSERELRNAMSLATFLSSQQQSIRFMRDGHRVPADPSVNVDRRIYPIINGFSRQSDTAVVLPYGIPVKEFFAAGNRAFSRVLSDLMSPEEATCAFGQEVVELINYATADVILPDGCE